MFYGHTINSNHLELPSALLAESAVIPNPAPPASSGGALRTSLCVTPSHPPHLSWTGAGLSVNLVRHGMGMNADSQAWITQDWTTHSPPLRQCNFPLRRYSQAPAGLQLLLRPFQTLQPDPSCLPHPCSHPEPETNNNNNKSLPQSTRSVPICLPFLPIQLSCPPY